MLKIFKEVIVWMSLTCVLAFTIYSTFALRDAKCRCMEIVSEHNSQAIQTGTMRNFGIVKITWGYAYIRPDQRGWQSFADERIPKDEGFFILVDWATE